MEGSNTRAGLLLQRHLVAVEGVDEASLQQVQDLDRAVAGAADQEVVGRMDGEAVDAGAVDWTKRIGRESKRITGARHTVDEEEGSSSGLLRPL